MAKTGTKAKATVKPAPSGHTEARRPAKPSPLPNTPKKKTSVSAGKVESSARTYDAKAHEDIQAKIRELQASEQEQLKLQSRPQGRARAVHTHVQSTPGPSRHRSRSSSPLRRRGEPVALAVPMRQVSATPLPGRSTADVLELAQEELAEMDWDEDANEVEEDDGVQAGINKEDNEAAADPDSDDITPTMFEQLIQELRAAKKRRNRIKTNDTPAYHLKMTSRQVIRLTGPHIIFIAMFTTGLSVMALGAMDATEREKRIDVVAHHSDKKTAREHLTIFENLCVSFPFLANLLPHLVKGKRIKTMHIFTLAQFMGHHANAARSSDISAIKVALFKFLPDATTKNGVLIKTLEPQQHIKERNFGYHSLCTGRLLTPIDRVAEFDDDPEGFCYRMTHNTTESALLAAQAAKAMPAFIFKEDVLGFYDPSNPSKGIFMSRFLVDVYRNLMTGPSSATSPAGNQGNGRSTLSRKWSLTLVTPEYLTYVASLLNFALSDEGGWTGSDPGGWKQALYNDMSKYLRVEYDDFMNAEDGDIEDEIGTPEENLFAWWNRWVYGTSLGETSAVGASFLNDPRFQDDLPDVRRDILEEGAATCEIRQRAREARRQAREASVGPSASAISHNPASHPGSDNSQLRAETQEPQSPSERSAE